MTRTKWAWILLAGSWLAGCAMGGSAGRQYHQADYQARKALDASVIQASDAILSEEAIQTLLSSKVVLPGKAKLAVVNLGHRSLATSTSYSHWAAPTSEAFLQAKREFLDAIERPLMASGRFTEITHVPGMLIPEKPSLVRMREAAALMQADVLLAYKSRSQLITDWHLFSKDEIKSHASIDFVLVDVRTGVIPFAETLEATHLEREKSADTDSFETRKRADRAVTLKVIGAAVERLSKFLTGSAEPST